MRLDLQEMEELPTNKVHGFAERLQSLLPSMKSHECSEGEPGGFFSRLKEGTWMGHVIEHVALELQSLAGMEVGYGRTRSTGEYGVYNVVFAYEVEEAGLYAAKAAFELVQGLIEGSTVHLEKMLIQLRTLSRKHGLGPSTKSIVDEAIRRNIPWQRLDNNSWIQLGYGANQVQFQATITGRTNSLGVDISCNKALTKRLLEQHHFPIPKGRICTDNDELKQAIIEIGYPMVIKPIDANQGKGATINITDSEQARKAFKLAQSYSRTVIAEQYVSGADFRILVVNYKVVAVAKRVPAHVVGDGFSTIAQLVDKENANPLRESGHENILTKIELDAQSEQLLARRNYSIHSVPGEGEEVYLKSTANLSTGGTAIDITDEVHPQNLFLAERIARIVGLDICGIDIIAQNLTTPITTNGGVILEVNAAPGFRMHLHPTEGKPRNVAQAVLDMLYPPGKSSRIPIIAVTGTNGKTTTTRLLAHMAQKSGFRTGFTTTDGIYINNFEVTRGDTTGPVSASYVLRDPTVEFAVLETARGGILRSGLAFHQCDVAIITNVREDHLGLNDIHTVSDLANVKAVVARSVRRNGWAVLNADDEQCLRIAKELDCKVAFFSLDPKNPEIRKRMERNQPVAVFENNFLTIIVNGQKLRVAPVSEVPVSYDGAARFMVANALAAVLAGYLWGFQMDDIRKSLRDFNPGYAQTPGRLNMFASPDFKVLVDYAHNPHGYRAVEEFVGNLPASRKIGIISGLGDRRDEDIVECSRIAAQMFDMIIIRQESDLRGRKGGEILQLITTTISASGRDIPFVIIPDETEAIRYALSVALPGDLIVALSEVYKNVVEYIQKTLKDETENRMAHDSSTTRKERGAAPMALDVEPKKVTYYGNSA